LGLLKKELGSYKEAGLLLQESFEIRQRHRDGRQSLALAQSHFHLAQLRQTQGMYADAEQHFQASLEIRNAFLGSDQPDIVKSMAGLAGLYLSVGRYGEAEQLLMRSRSILTSALGPQHPEIGTVLSDLGQVYQYQGRYAEAEPLYQESLDIRRR